MREALEHSKKALEHADKVRKSLEKREKTLYNRTVVSLAQYAALHLSSLLTMLRREEEQSKD